MNDTGAGDERPEGIDVAPDLAVVLRAVRALGDGPTPAPSAALAAVLRGELTPAEAAASDVAPSPGPDAHDEVGAAGAPRDELAERRRRAALRAARIAGGTILAAAIATGAAALEPMPTAVREPARALLTGVISAITPWEPDASTGTDERDGHGADDATPTDDSGRGAGEDDSEGSDRPGGSGDGSGREDAGGDDGAPGRADDPDGPGDVGRPDDAGQPGDGRPDDAGQPGDVGRSQDQGSSGNAGGSDDGGRRTAPAQPADPGGAGTSQDGGSGSGGAADQTGETTPRDGTGRDGSRTRSGDATSPVEDQPSAG